MGWQTFYSYSHKDEELRKRLGVYLGPLRHKGKIVEWHDRMIEPGSDWNAEISARLDAANLVLLLLSPEFLDSDYCFGVEVDRCLARLKTGTLKVVPVLLRPCLWEDSPFSELQIIPRDGKALVSSNSSEELWKDVAVEISKMVSEPPPAVQAPAHGSGVQADAIIGARVLSTSSRARRKSFAGRAACRGCGATDVGRSGALAISREDRRLRQAICRIPRGASPSLRCGGTRSGIIPNAGRRARWRAGRTHVGKCRV
jgi:hypothetical protein